MIELVAVIPIILIVLTLIFAINDFSNKIFDKSVNQSYNQQNVRLAADYITNELRNAKEINTNQNNISAENNIYYALTVKNNELVKQTINGSTISEKVLVNQLSNMIIDSSSNGSILNIKVEDKNNNQDYSLTFSCLLNNTTIPQLSQNPNIIYYTTY